MNDRLASYSGTSISLTLRFLKSTSLALSHLKVATGPPQVIIWSGSPPHSSPLSPHPPSSRYSSTFTQSFPSLSISSQFSIFTTVVFLPLSSFCSILYTTNLYPIHLPSIEEESVVAAFF